MITMVADSMEVHRSLPTAFAFLERQKREPRELVGPFVLGMTGMTADPRPFHLVGGHRFLQALPEIGVLDRLAVGGEPAIVAPLVDPPGDAVPKIDGIGMEPHAAGPSQRLA